MNLRLCKTFPIKYETSLGGISNTTPPQLVTLTIMSICAMKMSRSTDVNSTFPCGRQSHCFGLQEARHSTRDNKRGVSSATESSQRGAMGRISPIGPARDHCHPNARGHSPVPEPALPASIPTPGQRNPIRLKAPY